MQIYISHAERDRSLAQALATKLEEAGLSVWNEEREIYPGDNWAKKIGEALESSEVLVTLVTRPEMDTESVARDVQYALTQGRNYHGRIVPVFVGVQAAELDESVPWILTKFNPVQVAASGEGFEEVIRRIQSLSDDVCHAAR